MSKMKLFQYGVSRYIIHFGLWIMPACKFKVLLLDKMYEAADKVHKVIGKDIS